jgi:hypothetical protein
MSGLGTTAGVVAAVIAVAVGVLAVLRIVRAEQAVDAARGLRAGRDGVAGSPGAIRPRGVVRLDRALVAGLALLGLALAAVMAIVLVG